jgi:hypothetical protein
MTLAYHFCENLKCNSFIWFYSGHLSFDFIPDTFPLILFRTLFLWFLIRTLLLWFNSGHRSFDFILDTDPLISFRTLLLRFYFGHFSFDFILDTDPLILFRTLLLRFHSGHCPLNCISHSLHQDVSWTVSRIFNALVEERKREENINF